MMIDEIIKGLEKASDYLLNAVGGYPLNEAEEKMINSIDYAIEFIEWYYSQDLIKCEDAIETLTQLEWYNEDGYSVEDYDEKRIYASDWVGIVPKAEPPKERYDK